MLILPKLTTNRLLLRPVTIEDADSIFAYSCNPNVARYVTWEPHSTIEDTKNVIISFFLKNYMEGMPAPWAITFKEHPDKVVGLVGCRFFDEDPKAMELAYVLAEEHWGQGITVEAVQAILPYIFQNYPIDKLVGRYSALNPASGRVMEKLGMKFVKTYQGERKGKIETMRFYALEQSDMK
ncbi:MAG: GNAT family N-acetyltransferase [Alphaproteobacteria bacterium]|nr:GNAT family N-acetyltransferase [Alphaproteobacteria bacterium]